MAAKTNKILLLIVKLCVSSGLLYFVLSKAGIGKVLGLLGSINVLAFAGAVGIYLFAQFVSSIRWQTLLAGGHPLKRLFNLYLLGSLFNTVLPGLVGGDAVKAYYLYKERGGGGDAIASVFMDRYIGFIALLGLGMAAYPFGLLYFGGSWVEWLLPSIAGGFVFSSILIFGLKIGKRFEAVASFYDYFHSTVRNRPVFYKALALSAIVQLLNIILVYLLSLGLGIEAPPVAFFIFIPVAIALSAVPLSISGLGIREAAFVLLFGLVGVSPEAATALSFSWFLVMACGGFFGIFEYLKGRSADVPKDFGD